MSDGFEGGNSEKVVVSEFVTSFIVNGRQNNSRASSDTVDDLVIFSGGRELSLNFLVTHDAGDCFVLNMVVFIALNVS